jgi:hypothetical protein
MDGKESSTCANVSSPPIHPMRGSIKGGDCRSKRSFQSRERAFPEVITDRDGRKITASALLGMH